MSLYGRIYRGQIDFNFPRINRRLLVLSAVLIIVSLGAIITQGLNLSVDFVGGTVWEVPSKTLTQGQATEVLAKNGAASGSKIQIATDANNVRLVRVQSGVTDQKESAKITKDLAEAAKVKVTQVETNFVGPTWGKTVTRQAVKAFIIFLILVLIQFVVIVKGGRRVSPLGLLAHGHQRDHPVDPRPDPDGGAVRPVPV